jgi:dolichyl-phosphate-mannose--protein O-mannosyl transferase
MYVFTCVLSFTNLRFFFSTFQLPTLYFAVLMLSHVLDHFIFSSKRYTKKTKNVIFGVVGFIIVFNFWWFKGVVFGIPGPIGEHKGLQWRKVCNSVFLNSFLYSVCIEFSSRGIYMID